MHAICDDAVVVGFLRLLLSYILLHLRVEESIIFVLVLVVHVRGVSFSVLAFKGKKVMNQS